MPAHRLAVVCQWDAILLKVVGMYRVSCWSKSECRLDMLEMHFDSLCQYFIRYIVSGGRLINQHSLDDVLVETVGDLGQAVQF